MNLGKCIAVFGVLALGFAAVSCGAETSASNPGPGAADGANDGGLDGTLGNSVGAGDADAGSEDHADADAGPEHDADTRRGFNGQPCSQYTYCVLDGGSWTCDCGSTNGGPACPPSANEGTACSSPSPWCFGCYQGATFGCQCSDAGSVDPDASSLGWRCIGGGQACPQ
jgi:hypothetical protein